MLPFYKERGITIKVILTDNGREFCGRDIHPYELYLALYDIEHRRTKVRSPKTNGFAERFNRTALDEFLRSVSAESVGALQNVLDKWLYHYKYKRPHLGYRNMGKRPADTVERFLKLQDMKAS